MKGKYRTHLDMIILLKELHSNIGYSYSRIFTVKIFYNKSYNFSQILGRQGVERRDI